jgi:hypothetical protein
MEMQMRHLFAMEILNTHVSKLSTGSFVVVQLDMGNMKEAFRKLFTLWGHKDIRFDTLVESTVSIVFHTPDADKIIELYGPQPKDQFRFECVMDKFDNSSVAYITPLSPSPSDDGPIVGAEPLSDHECWGDGEYINCGYCCKKYCNYYRGEGLEG